MQPKPDVYIAPLGSGMDRESARLARELRRQGIIVELGDETFRLKKSFETAAKLGIRPVLICGENESRQAHRREKTSRRASKFLSLALTWPQRSVDVVPPDLTAKTGLDGAILARRPSRRSEKSLSSQSASSRRR